MRRRHSRPNNGNRTQEDITLELPPSVVEALLRQAGTDAIGAILNAAPLGRRPLLPEHIRLKFRPREQPETDQGLIEVVIPAFSAPDAVDVPVRSRISRA